jgi:hypothetical protein
MAPLNCSECGRFVGKDGDPDIVYDYYTGGYEVGYPLCGPCLRATQAALKKAEATNSEECTA